MKQEDIEKAAVRKIGNHETSPGSVKGMIVDLVKEAS